MSAIFFVEEGVMQKRARQKLKMFTSLFLCIASLFSCVTLTLAWFAFNNNVSGGGIGVGAEKKADLIAYEYYVADTGEANKDRFLFVKTTDETKQKPGAYDVLNRKYQLMIKLYLRADAQKVLVSAETDTNYFLGDGTQEHRLAAALPADGTLKNPLSSVVAMRGVAAGEELAGDTNNGYVWTENADKEYVKFMAGSSANSVPRSAITMPEITLPESTETFTGTGYDGSAYTNAECKTAFILISYDAALIEAVFSANIGNSDIVNLDEVPFMCDFEIKVQAD